jgi:hypothetical protein
MLKRTLVIAAAVIAAQSGVALADNNWTFDDAYWKNPALSGSATSMRASDNRKAARRLPAFSIGRCEFLTPGVRLGSQRRLGTRAYSVPAAPGRTTSRCGDEGGAP